MVETSIPKTMLGTTVKLNGSSYLLWAQAFRIFIGAQNKLALFLQSPLVDTDPTYVTWLTENYSVMTWLLNSLKEKIGSVMFLTTVKDMWDTLKVMYGNEKNPSRVFKICERMFKLKHADRSVPALCDELKGLIDELKMHQPAVTNAATLRGYVGISQYQSFYLTWALHYDLRCGVRFWEEIAFPWLPPSRELCEYLLELMFPLH